VGNPPQRPDQLLQPGSRAGVGPAPQNQVFIGRLVVVFGTGPATGIFFYNGSPGARNPPILAITTASADPYGNTVTPSAITDTGMPILIYSGTPAAGNLILALAPQAGTDSFGNAYVQGLTFTDSSDFQIELTYQSSAAVLRFKTNRATEASAAIAASQVFNSGGTNEVLNLALFGPREQMPDNDGVGVMLNSSAKDASSPATGQLVWIPSGSGVSQPEAGWTSSGLYVYAYSDGNAYDCARGTLIVLSTITVNNPAGQTILTVDVQPGTYRVHGFLECVQGPAAVVQNMGFGGPATGSGPTRIRYWFIEQGLAQTFSNYSNIGSGLGDVGSPAYGIGDTFWFEFEGMVSFTAAGAFGITAVPSSAVNDFQIITGSFMDIMPCVQTVL
jgi:hypothetical protein